MTQTNPQSDLPPQQAVKEAPHKPADDREEVYYDGSPLLRGELGKFSIYFLIAMVLIIGPLVLRFAADVRIPALVLAILILIGLLVLFFPILKLKTIKYRISNYRIDFERGLIAKNIDTLELWHVEDVRLHQSMLDRLLGCGTITIISKDDTTPKLDLHSLPDPRPLFEHLKQRIIAVKRQRGVIKMDVG
jgi:membrane protein YdbS with pleckstrin-like domain